MTKNKFFCGLGMGLVAGVALSASLSMNRKKRGRSAVGKKLKSIGEIIGEAFASMGL